MKYNFMKLLQEGGTTPPPASGVSYNFDTFLNNLPTNEFSRGQTRSSIAWTPNWSDQAGKYENVRALEANDKYLAFTNYVLQNASKDPRVMDYLKLLEQSTTGNGHKAILFNGDLLNSNWQSEYQRLRNDGKYGFYHLGPEGDPELPPETPSETPPEIPLVPPETHPETPPETPPEEIPTIPQKPDPTPWTDWIPLSAQLANSLISADRLAALQKKMRFPLVEVPYLQHKITNDYHLRTGLQQNANDLRTLGAYRSNSADLRENMDNMLKYDTLATDIENQAEQHKADTTFKERGIAELVAHENIKNEVEGANLNNRSNVMAWNNILDANARRDLRRTEALNSYIGNMYTSHGEWLKDMRLNDLAYQRGLNAYDASLKQQEAYLKYQDLTSDFSKSQAFNDFWEAVKLPGEKILVDDPADYENIDKIKALWAGDSDLAKEYRAKWEDEKNNALNNLYLQNQQIGNSLTAKNLLLPAIVNNQGIYYNPYRNNNISPIFRGAKGGSLRARYIDYANHIQREQQKQKELLHKRNELSQKRLTTDLDRLSRELSILLRSVFK